MADYSTKAPGVYLEEVSGVRPISGVGTALPAFLGLAPKGPTTPTLVANWTQYVERFGGIRDGMSLGKAVYAYIANGGSACMVVRVGGDDTDGPVAAYATLRTPSGEDVLVVTAREPGSRGNDITVEVLRQRAPDDGDDAGGPADTAGEEGAGARPDTGAPSTLETFRVHVRTGTEVETYDDVTAASLLSRLESSSLVSASHPPGAPTSAPASGTTQLSGGTDGAEISAEAFVGDEQARTGLAGLVAEDEVTMVLAPDLVTALARGALTPSVVAGVQAKMIDHCDTLKDRMTIIDPPLFAPDSSGVEPLTVQQVLTWRDGLQSSKFAATYYPWPTVVDLASGRQVAEPPSGFIAGVWARNDAENGVGSAPTGRLRHATGLTRRVTDAEQGLLNPRGVNCLRTFRGSGTVVWGARTLSEDAEWRYLNVRRLFNFVEESVVEGTRFAVFSPNDADLWARLRRSVRAFLLGVWRDGALVGATPEQAFYVKCDAETNPSDVVDRGMVVVEIGLAPVKPAEFIIVRFSQSSQGADVSE